MEIAWTTILIIALLLPGVFFFIGYYSGHRYAHDVVRTSAIGEVGVAVFIAIGIHLLGWFVLYLCFGFDLAHTLEEATDYGDGVSYGEFVQHVVSRITGASIYILAAALAGLVLGWLVSAAVNRGLLPFLETHKWINKVRRSMKGGLVTAYVMTTTVQNNKVLMYKGVLTEFFQKKEGQFEYVVLSDCSSYFMNFDEPLPKTGKHRDLFSNHPERQRGDWDFLQIEGANIANILFDPSPQILETDAGIEALNKALKQVQEEIARLTAQMPTRAEPPQSN